MKPILTTLALATLAPLVTSCDSPQPPPSAAPTPSGLQHTRSLPIGASFTVDLGEGNDGTGYSWSLASTPQSCQVSFETRTTLKSQPSDKPNEKIIVGGPNRTLATITAKHAGEETLVFIYSRPWEKDAKPAKTHEVQVKVTN